MTEFYVGRQLADVAVGNDKTLVTDTEPIGLVLEVLAITYTATATVGTRAIDVVVLDDGDVELFRLTDVVGPTGPTAGLTESAYIYPGSGDGEIPPFVFRPGFKIQVVDTADDDVLDTCVVTAYFAGQGRIG